MEEIEKKWLKFTGPSEEKKVISVWERNRERKRFTVAVKGDVNHGGSRLIGRSRTELKLWGFLLRRRNDFCEAELLYLLKERESLNPNSYECLFGLRVYSFGPDYMAHLAHMTF